MTDPLQDDREKGLAAGIRIIEDFSANRKAGYDEAAIEVVEAIRVAARNDTKFNWHLLERIALLAVLGFETTTAEAKLTE